MIRIRTFVWIGTPLLCALIGCGDDAPTGGSGAGSEGGGGETGELACSASEPCPQGQGACDFPDDACEAEAEGVCRIGDCEPGYRACSCDGVVRDLCEVVGSGPVADASRCATGTFACGDEECTTGIQACYSFTSGVDGTVSYSCRAAGPECTYGVVDCNCMSASDCPIEDGCCSVGQDGQLYIDEQGA